MVRCSCAWQNLATKESSVQSSKAYIYIYIYIYKKEEKRSVLYKTSDKQTLHSGVALKVFVEERTMMERTMSTSFRGEDQSRRGKLVTLIVAGSTCPLVFVAQDFLAVWGDRYLLGVLMLYCVVWSVTQRVGELLCLENKARSSEFWYVFLPLSSLIVHVWCTFRR